MTWASSRRTSGDMMRAVDGKAYLDALKRNYRHEIAAALVYRRDAPEPWLGPAARSLVTAVSKCWPLPATTNTLPTISVRRIKIPESHWLETRPFNAVKAAYALAKEMFRAQGWTLRLPSFNSIEVERMLGNHDERANHPFRRMMEARDGLAVARARKRPTFAISSSCSKGC